MVKATPLKLADPLDGSLQDGNSRKIGQNGTPPVLPRNSDPDFTLLQLQSQLENEEGPDKIVVLQKIGKALVQKRRYADALPVYESLLTSDPTSVQTQESLARCLERLGQFGEAAARYQLVLDSDPERSDASAGMGICLLRQDNHLAALAAFDRCLQLNSSHLGALLGKATCLRLTGKDAEAEAIYREAVRVEPTIESSLDVLIGVPGVPPPAAQRSLASEIGELENVIAAAVAAEDFSTAAESCRSLAELSPDYYEAWFNLGAFEQRNSNLAAAADAFDRAARQRPLSVEPLQALAQTYHLQGDLKRAEAGYQAALALTPDAPDLMWNLGLALEQNGDLAGAAKQYSRLVKSDQDRGEAWFRLGFVRLFLEDHEGAVVAFRRALDLGAETFEANYNLGLAYWHLGRTDQAADTFRAALTMQPRFAPARSGLAAVALRESDFPRALELLRDLVESGHAGPEIHFNLAVLEHRANRLNSAIEFYKEALRLDPDLADAAAGIALARATLSSRRYK